MKKMLFICIGAVSMYDSQIKEEIKQLQKIVEVETLWLLYPHQINELRKKTELGNIYLINFIFQIKNFFGIQPLPQQHLKQIFHRNSFDYIYGRTVLGGYISMLLVKRMNLTTKIITDYRGIVSDELKYEPSLYNLFKSYWYQKYEEQLLTKSDLILCVSNNFKEHLLSLNNNIDRSKIIVTRPYIAKNRFYFSQTLRNRVREKLNFSKTDIVLIFAGGAHKWQSLDLLFKTYVTLRRYDGRFRLLILSPDVNQFNNVSNKYNLKDQVIIRNIDNKNVNQYLNAADYGLLIRNKSKTNIVSYPTKFSEYQLSGLPTITNSNVGSYSDCNANNSIVIGSDSINQQTIKKLLKPSNFNRKIISMTYKKKLANTDFFNWLSQ